MIFPLRYSMHLSAPRGGLAQMVQSEEGMWIAYDDFIRSKASSDVMHDAKNATIDGLVEERDRLLKQIEELKHQPDPLTAYLYAAELAKDAMKKLKAELTDCKAESDRLKAENAYLKSEVDRLKNNVAYLDKTLDDHLDKSLKRVNDEIDEVRIGNALMRERLEAMKRLDDLRRMKDKSDPLTDQQG